MPKPTPNIIDKENIVSIAMKVIENAKFPMLSTIEHNQPRVRPISPVHTDGFTIYFANLRSYKKTKQIRDNPRVELCYMDSDHNQVRITGVAEVVTERSLLEFFWKKNRLLEHYLGTIDNPELIVYKVKPSYVSYMQEWALNYIEVPIPPEALNY